MSNNDTYSDFECFAAQCKPWVRHLKRTWSKFDDADAEIRLSMWHHYCRGVRDGRKMFSLVSNDVRRFCRREMRQWDIALRLVEKTPSVDEDPESDLVEQLGIANLVEELARLPVPAKARPWVDHKCGVGPAVNPAQRMAGRRWADQARKVLTDA